MIYKTIEKWKGYEVGDIVPQEEAESFLKRYKEFEHQQILERVEGQAPKQKESEDVKPVAKKVTKKKTISVK
jgi:hypothetical protein